MSSPRFLIRLSAATDRLRYVGLLRAATSGLAHAMEVALIVVLAITALSLPLVALMPRKASAEPQQ
jgi:hypothetical protein